MRPKTAHEYEWFSYGRCPRCLEAQQPIELLSHWVTCGHPIVQHITLPKGSLRGEFLGMCERCLQGIYVPDEGCPGADDEWDALTEMVCGPDPTIVFQHTCPSGSIE